MLNTALLKEKLNRMSVEELRNECLNLSYFVSNCKDILQGRKIFGNTVKASDLQCKSEAIELIGECRKITVERKEKRLNFINQVLKNEQKK